MYEALFVCKGKRRRLVENRGRGDRGRRTREGPLGELGESVGRRTADATKACFLEQSSLRWTRHSNE